MIPLPPKTFDIYIHVTFQLWQTFNCMFNFYGMPCTMYDSGHRYLWRCLRYWRVWLLFWYLPYGVGSVYKGEQATQVCAGPDETAVPSIYFIVLHFVCVMILLGGKPHCDAICDMQLWMDLFLLAYILCMLTWTLQ